MAAPVYKNHLNQAQLERLLNQILDDLTTLYTRQSSSLKASATYDPPNLVDGAGTTTTVTVTGALLGDFAETSFSLDTSGITITAWVSAADTVSVRFQNESGGTLNIASGTLTVVVRPNAVNGVSPTALTSTL